MLLTPATWCLPNSDRLTQIYIIHRSYLSPIRVSRYKPYQSPNCVMCNQATGTFYHLLWSCPKIHGFWTQIVQFLHDTMGSPLALQPKPCLLGIHPESDMNKCIKIFLNETLFSARKVIARQWMRTNPPEFSAWLIEVNSIRYKKLIYTHRGCPAKYGKIWDRWLQAPETLDRITVA